ncbi:hypothetical protein C8R43DRAFT_126128 [Mycena crocata]|nr:hypothetical protein C8R43DRAFT_126128 [Mycena crocata]
MASPLGGISAEVVALNDYAAVRYTNIAFLAFMIYDHAITFDTEVSRIWTLQWRLPKVLFLINRYVVPPMLMCAHAAVPAIYDLPEFFCTFIAKWTSWPTIISIGTVEIILILRVLAICGHRKIIRQFLVGSFICEMIVWITLSSVILAKTTGYPGGSLFPGCLFSAPKYFFAAWYVRWGISTTELMLRFFRIPAVVFESEEADV